VSDNFPKSYSGNRWMHDDWAIAGIPWQYQPWCWIPRRWTGLGLMMPPQKVCGSASSKYIEVQPGYPIAPDSAVLRGSWNVREGYLLPDPYGDRDIVLSLDPVHKADDWSIQSVYLHLLHCRIPCFLSFSVKIKRFNRILHFNGPLKPDITPGDWYWWIECSLTFKKA